MFRIFDLTNEEALVVENLLNEVWSAKGKTQTPQQVGYYEGIKHAIGRLLASKKIFISDETVEQIINEYFAYKDMLWEERSH